MLKCKNCQQPCNDLTSFCPSCGEMVVSEKQANATGQTKKHVILLNLFYVFILFTVFFPMLFPGSTFRGYGEFGYGLRQQVSAFADLAKPSMTTGVLLIINSLVIVLIIAIIFSVCFTVISMIFINRTAAKKESLNFRLLKIFNLCIFCSFTFMFITTFPYLTFSFMCSYLLSFFALLIALKPDFASDLLARKGNEDKNSSAIMIIMTSVLFAFCFSPIYRVSNIMYQAAVVGSKNSWVSYNFFDFIMSLFKGESLTVDNFLIIMSIILMVLIFLLLVFSTVKYLVIKGKPRLNYLNIAVLILSIICIILIGSFIRIENQRAANPPELGGIYYIFLTLTIAAAIIPFIHKAIDYKTSKKLS